MLGGAEKPKNNVLVGLRSTVSASRSPTFGSLGGFRSTREHSDRLALGRVRRLACDKVNAPIEQAYISILQ